MTYRTKTYIAADWDNDGDAVRQLREWNDSDFLTKIDFVDVHEYVQARDSSLCCTIKRSLNERMNMSKTFILIVGAETDRLTKGSCQYCEKYIHRASGGACISGNAVNYRSYIEHECSLAIKGKLNIVVLYKSSYVNKQLCPEIIRNIGVHSPMKENGKYSYSTVRDAILRAERTYLYSLDLSSHAH